MPRVLDTILDMFSSTALANLPPPQHIEMSQDMWLKLLSQTEASPTRPTEMPDTLFGMKVVVDPRMGPGEWKLVPPNPQA